jgi:uracil-DNA glycosylase
MIGPVVHGPAVDSRVMLIGQAPGPREGSFGRPFAWTAGRTLFRWLLEATGADEAVVRERVYFAAVARCFPGKAPGGGDRRPDPVEIENCRTYLQAEVRILRPELIIPVGTLAIAETTGHRGKLADIVGTRQTALFHGTSVDVIALPHPSGASTWHRTTPGLELLATALQLLGMHPAVRTALS